MQGSDYNGSEMLEYLKATGAKVNVVDTEKLCAECGSTKVMNVILLGAAVRSGVLGIGADEIKKALLERIPSKHHELNVKALRLGLTESI